MSHDPEALASDRFVSRVAAGVRAWRDTSLAPLKIPLFFALWAGAMVANLGAVIQTVAASWEMATLTSSAQMVALVQTASVGPFVPLALPAGAVADSYDRRIVMIIAQIACLIAALTLATFSFLGLSTPVVLLAFTAIIGAAVAFHQPAWQASFADVVPRAVLPATIALSALTFNVARSLGPAIGGVVTATFGVATAFSLTTLSFVALILVLLNARFAPAPNGLPREPIVPAMLAGLRFASVSRPVQVVLARMSVFAFGGSAIAALSPLIAQDQLHGDAVTYGLLLSAFGVGALCAALGSAHLRATLGSERLTGAAIVVFAIGTLGIGLSSNLLVSLLCNVMAGGAWTFVFTTSTTCIQMNTPRWVMGRAIAIYQVATLGSLALGAALWGAVAHATNLPTAFAAAAAFGVVNLVIARLAPFPSESTDLSPHEGPPVPAPRLALEARDGPIVTTIEYRVPSNQLEAFRAVMRQLGRVRRRDGARRWDLQQNIDDPELWIERIESSTWIDVLRRIQRGTVADEKLRAEAFAFRNTQTPVRRWVERGDDAGFSGEAS